MPHLRRGSGGGFRARAGPDRHAALPERPGVRNDAGVYAGAEVPVYYDPMISKLAVWGRDRAEAIERMRRALGEFEIAGELTTNLDFHRWLMNHPVFLERRLRHQLHRAGISSASARRGGRQIRPEFIAAMLAVAAAAQNLGTAGTKAPAAGRGAARGGSAWKTLGRLDGSGVSGWTMRYLAPRCGMAEHEFEFEAARRERRLRRAAGRANASRSISGASAPTSFSIADRQSFVRLRRHAPRVKR